MAEIGRTEFLEAATTIKRMRAFLEGKRKEIDRDLVFFNGAEQALAVLGEADRARLQVEAKITEARERLEMIDRRVLEAEAASREAIEGFQVEIAEAREKAKIAVAAAAAKGNAATARMADIAEMVSLAEKKGKGALEDLQRQINEKETALSALRETIAGLAKF